MLRVFPFQSIFTRRFLTSISHFFKDRIKAKDLDGKKGEVLEGWFKRISEEDDQAEALGLQGCKDSANLYNLKVVDEIDAADVLL